MAWSCFTKGGSGVQAQPGTGTSTFSTQSGMNIGSRVDQPGAVAAASLIDWSKVRRRPGWRCGRLAAEQKAAGSHGRALAPISRS
jgi:hypothetical protein